MRNWIYFFLCLQFVILLVACGKAKDPVDTKNMVYHAEKFNLPEVKGSVERFSVWNDRVYMYTAQWDETKQEETHYLYSATVDGKDVQSLTCNIEEGELQDVMFLPIKDSLCFFAIIQNAKGQLEYSVIDDSGATVMQLTDQLQLNGEESIIRAMQGKNDSVIIATSKHYYILDQKGKLKDKITPQDSYIQSVARTKDGDVVNAQLNNNKLKIQVLDTDKCTWNRSITIATGVNAVGDILMDGVDYDFYYRDDSGIYGYSIKDSSQKKLLDYAASNIQSSYAYSIVPVGDGQMLGIADFLADKDAKLVAYRKVEPGEVREKTVLTYGTLQLNDRVKDAVMQFNQNNTQYEIRFNDYSVEEDPETAFAKDVVSGNVPDILDVTGMSVRQYVEKGLLEDLTPYYDQDEEVNVDDLIPSVAEAMKMDEKYYYVCPTFLISSLVGKEKDVGANIDWDVRQLMQFVDQHPSARLFYDTEKKDILNILIAYNISKYVDWKTGECTFDKEEFRGILEFCNRESDSQDGTENEAELLRNGKVLLKPVVVGAEDIEIYRAMYQDDIAFAGYPNEQGSGTYFVFQHQLGMSSQSKNKEGVWEFLRMFMKLDYQGKIQDVNEMNAAAPTRRDAFEMYMQTRTATQDYVDQLGNVVESLQYKWWYDDFEWDLRPLTSEEAEQYVELVNHVTQTEYYETQIMAIVEGEAKAYFAGQQTLDKTIEVIQDRAAKYVNENR